MSLKDKGLEVRFESHAWKGERTDKRIVSEVAASHQTNQGIGRFNRSLFPNCDAPLKNVLNSIEHVRETNERYTVPWGVVRAVQIEFYPVHRDKTKEAIGRFDIALQQFHDAYPTMVKQGLAASNGLATSDEYIQQDEIYSRFGVSITYSQMTDVGDWISASMLTPDEQKELVTQTQASNARYITEALSSVKDQFCRILAQSRDNLTKTVQKSKDKRFNVGWLTNLQQFCEIWPGLNLNADPLVPQMLADLQPVLKHTPETMKTSKQAQAEAYQCLISFIQKYGDWLNG